MVVLRKRPKGARAAPFGLGVLVFALAPAQIGYQDLGALIARQPVVSERWRQHLIASPFGTIHAATFSFPRPLGTAIPEPLGYRLAGLDPRALDIAGAIHDGYSIVPARQLPPPIAFPTVARGLKGDRLAARPQVDERPGAIAPRPDQPQADAATDAEGAKSAESSLPAQGAGAAFAPTEREEKISRAGDADAPDSDTMQPIEAAPAEIGPHAATEDNPARRTARLYFGIDPMGLARAAIERWAPGEAPVLVAHTTGDPDIKRSALAPADLEKSEDGTAAAIAAGESIAGKGEVTGEGRRPKSPAERLALAGQARAKSEKCLADAVYFEARGEPERGQKAVAQVVMNRVFSGFYPDNVCGVVYQNAHRRLACQFTFTCDGIPDRVNEPALWAQAKRIARDTLDGKIWLPEIGKATHYHASYVHPWWVRTMRKHKKIGVHIFYRPRKWGDGADEPVWGSAPAVAAGTETAAKL